MGRSLCLACAVLFILLLGALAIAYASVPLPVLAQSGVASGTPNVRGHSANEGNTLYLPVVLGGAPPAATPAPTVSPPEATPIPPATQPPSGPCSCASNLYNCSDFGSQAQAQACYDWCMREVGYDVHQLDRDHDGVACESLPLGWQVLEMDAIAGQ